MLKKTRLFWFFTCAYLGIATSLYAQDVENALENAKNFKEIEPLSYSGGFSLSTVNYAASGIAPRREPFAYAINANINITLFEKISMPFAINYVNGEGSFAGNNAVRDFIQGLLSRTGISPTYKGYTLHLGDRALDFSKYTYSGVRFYGIGAEAKPENAKFGLTMWRGRLSQRVFADTLAPTPVMPSYERRGYGFKLDLGRDKHVVSLILFGAKDQFNSSDSISSSFNVKPQANMVVGINTKNKITKKLDFTFEWAASAFTDDLRSPERLSEERATYFNNLGNIFDPRTSTRYNNVINTGLNYKGRGWTLGGNYLRVDPTYRSLGSVSIRNDVEAITAKGTLSLIQGKVNLGGNIGTEKNNLENTLALQMNRLIWGANVSWNVVQPLILSANYTNFNHSTEPSLLNVEDTIRLVQINAGQNYTAIYTLGKSVQHSFMANAAIQKATDIQDFDGINAQDIENSNLVNNYMFTYNASVKSLNLTAGLAFLYTDISGPQLQSTNYGPSVNVGKKFFQKKLDLKYAFAYMQSSAISTDQATLNNKLGAKYKLNDKNAFKIDLLLTSNSQTGDQAQDFTEFQGKFNYAFTF